MLGYVSLSQCTDKVSGSETSASGRRMRKEKEEARCWQMLFLLCTTSGGGGGGWSGNSGWKMCSDVGCDAPAAPSRLHEQPERCLALFFCFRTSRTEFVKVSVDPRTNQLPLRMKEQRQHKDSGDEQQEEEAAASWKQPLLKKLVWMQQ